MTIYLDHNASSFLKSDISDTIIEIISKPYNPSAIHKTGRKAKMMVEAARSQLSNIVNANNLGVIFTSGATEANNLALNLPLAKSLIISEIEHPSVLKTAKLKNAHVLSVTPQGIVDLNHLVELLKEIPQPALVSVMMVNNETGIIQPIKEIVEITRKYNGFVHSDVVQAIGRISVDMKAMGLDMVSLSSHKIGGMQGSGALVFENCVEPHPMLFGGGQEKNRRAGTENTASIIAFGHACDLAIQDMEDYNNRLKPLRDNMEDQLSSLFPDIIFYGQDVDRVSNTSMFTVPDILSETLLIALDLEGVAVSNGSACSSGTVNASYVLKAMNVNDKDASCALRISMGWNTIDSDIDGFIRRFEKIVTRIKSRIS